MIQILDKLDKLDEDLNHVSSNVCRIGDATDILITLGVGNCEKLCDIKYRLVERNALEGQRPCCGEEQADAGKEDAEDDEDS